MTTSPDASNGFRLTIMVGERNAQIWALRESGASFEEIGARFGLSRARAQQIHARCVERLSDWQEPNEWQATLPLRIRELCIAAGIETLIDLIRALLDSRAPRYWTADDVWQARRHFLNGAENADQVLLAIAHALGKLEEAAQSLRLCADAGIVGAELVRRGVLAMKSHGKAAYLATLRDTMIATALAEVTGEPT